MGKLILVLIKLCNGDIFYYYLHLECMSCNQSICDKY